MIYLYELKETGVVTFAVEADTNVDAEEKIFDWCEEHDDRLRDKIDRLTISTTKFERKFVDKKAYQKWIRLSNRGHEADFYLPEEKQKQENVYSLCIRYTDGSTLFKTTNKTIREIGLLLNEWSENYILVPDITIYDPEGQIDNDGHWFLFMAESRDVPDVVIDGLQKIVEEEENL